MTITLYSVLCITLTETLKYGLSDLKGQTDIYFLFSLILPHRMTDPASAPGRPQAHPVYSVDLGLDIL